MKASLSFSILPILVPAILIGGCAQAGEVSPSASAAARRRGRAHICKEVTARTETGNASYYDNKFVGRPMACNGRPFSQHNPTASIKLLPAPRGQKRRMLLPCGSIVRVTRTDIKAPDRGPLSVEVTVTDNGPLAPGRIIDLPTDVADKLHYGPGERGEVPVKVEVCSD